MAKIPQKQMYNTWEDGDNKAKALALYNTSQALNKLEPIVRSQGSNLYFNISPDTSSSVRDGFNRSDYEAFRPEEAIPTLPRDIISQCMKAYRCVGIIHNTIDMMGDFASKGIRFVHPNPKIQKFYQEYAKRINMEERSERFANYFFRCGQVIAKRKIAKLSVNDTEELGRSIAADTKVPALPVLKTREIPWGHTYLNPLSIELLGEDLAPFLGSDSFIYGIRIPSSLMRKVKNPQSDIDKQLVAKLPKKIRDAILDNQKVIALDSENIVVYYYRRDDWQAWAEPMLYSILPDIKMLQKMKLSDMAALDGVISSIRVWSLGNIEAKIMPSEAIMLRLAEMLTNNVGGGVMDLVWGPDIKLTETSTEAYKYLGETKYGPILKAINDGLGIPSTGTSTDGSSRQNHAGNYLTLQTLISRVKYGRNALKDMWENESKIIANTMGFRQAATVEFDNVLEDTSTINKLLMDMWDRGIITTETLREYTGINGNIEDIRVRKEMKQRQSGRLPPKASPYHNANEIIDERKIFASSGAYTPSEFGIELEKRKSGQDSPIEVGADFAPVSSGPGVDSSNKGIPGQGRPKGMKDKSQRKGKKRASAEFIHNLSLAEESLYSLSKIVTPIYLEILKKKTLRELSNEECKAFEMFKFSLLCQYQLGEEITDSSIREKIKDELSIPESIKKILEKTVSVYAAKNNKEPSLDILRRFHSSIFALYRGNYGEES